VAVMVQFATTLPDTRKNVLEVAASAAQASSAQRMTSRRGMALIYRAAGGAVKFLTLWKGNEFADLCALKCFESSHLLLCTKRSDTTRLPREDPSSRLVDRGAGEGSHLHADLGPGAAFRVLRRLRHAAARYF